ncbi:MAG: T9SS type A sorting domain-containing protein [Bacteroidota bacterium]
MKKNFTPKFEKKLARYTAVAGTVLAAGSANAQITYYDINPDITLANATAAIDITGDSNADYFFADTLMNGAWYAIATPIGTQALAGNTGGTGPYEYPFKLALNATIDNTLSWIAGGSGIQGSLALNANSTFPFSGSHWQNDATDGYLGARVDILGQTYYGWIRVSVAANTQSMIIKDLGLNMTANGPINAGQMPASVSENIDGKVTVVNYDNQLNITMLETLTNGNLTIVSTTGQVVRNTAVNGTTSVDLNGLAAGIYTVSLQFNEGVMVQKIMIR